MAAALPLVGGLVGSTILGSVFKKKTPTPAPTPAPQPVMPLPDDEAIKAAKKRSIVQQLSRGGRSSTILSDQSGDKLGG